MQRIPQGALCGLFFRDCAATRPALRFRVPGDAEQHGQLLPTAAIDLVRLAALLQSPQSGDQTTIDILGDWLLLDDALINEHGHRVLPDGFEPDRLLEQPMRFSGYLPFCAKPLCLRVSVVIVRFSNAITLSATWSRYLECRYAIFRADSNLSAVRVDDRLNDRQAQSCAVGLTMPGRVDPVEAIKKTRQVLRRNRRPRVFHDEAYG